jgi:radical SAM protein with 4Fe4S-binding SPASM domain
MSGLPPVGDAGAMLDRIAQARSVPLRAGIEISDRCNEVCVHCYQEQGRKGEMTTAELCQVIDQLADMGVLLLTLSGGECTLRKDFLEIVAHARARGFALRIFTNGLTMTRELAAALARHAVQMVEISLYSTRPEMHDFVTGVRGSFVRTVQGVRNLVELGVPVTVKTPLMNLNEAEIEPYVALATGLGAHYAFSADEIMPREGGERAPESFVLSDRGYRGATKQLAKLERLRVADSGPAPEPQEPWSIEASPCGAGQGLHVEPNGVLRPCTMLELDIGDALAEGVAAAHAANDAVVALRALRWADLHGCRECDLQTHCKRCYAAALASTGDALGPYESACRFARLTYESNTGRAPVIVHGADRDRAVGPYREQRPGVFEPFDHIITPEDEARAARLGWARRPTGSVSPPVVAARPGELIQIRRPGRKTSKLERIPVGADAMNEKSQSSTVEVARETRQMTETERRIGAS